MFQGARLEAGLRMAEALRQSALALNKTPAQVAIRWLLEQEGISCVLTGIKTPEQAEINARSADWTLPERAHEHLSQLAERLRSSIIP
jgi:aryl-alcohol dehydrogenase-like predicted oxidoreductase